MAARVGKLQTLLFAIVLLPCAAVANEAPTFTQQGQAALKAGKPGKAVELLTIALGQPNTTPEERARVFYLRAKAYLATNQPALASMDATTALWFNKLSEDDALDASKIKETAQAQATSTAAHRPVDLTNAAPQATPAEETRTVAAPAPTASAPPVKAAMPPVKAAMPPVKAAMPTAQPSPRPEPVAARQPKPQPVTRAEPVPAPAGEADDVSVSSGAAAPVAAVAPSTRVERSALAPVAVPKPDATPVAVAAPAPVKREALAPLKGAVEDSQPAAGGVRIINRPVTPAEKAANPPVREAAVTSAPAPAANASDWDTVHSVVTGALPERQPARVQPTAAPPPAAMPAAAAPAVPAAAAMPAPIPAQNAAPFTSQVDTAQVGTAQSGTAQSGTVQSGAAPSSAPGPMPENANAASAATEPEAQPTPSAPLALPSISSLTSLFSGTPNPMADEVAKADELQRRRYERIRELNAGSASGAQPVSTPAGSGAP